MKLSEKRIKEKRLIKRKLATKNILNDYRKRGDNEETISKLKRILDIVRKCQHCEKHYKKKNWCRYCGKMVCSECVYKLLKRGRFNGDLFIGTMNTVVCKKCKDEYLKDISVFKGITRQKQSIGKKISRCKAIKVCVEILHAAEKERKQIAKKGLS